MSVCETGGARVRVLRVTICIHLILGLSREEPDGLEEQVADPDNPWTMGGACCHGSGRDRAASHEGVPRFN